MSPAPAALFVRRGQPAAREIRAALHADALGDHLHAGHHALLDSLDIGRGFANYHLSTADRVFGHTGFPVRADYLATTREQYNAELQPLESTQHGPQSVDLSFPRFTTKHGFDLEATLGKLGILGAFDPLTADLSGIDGRRDLFVSAALHQAMLTVDEHGAQAAAATGEGFGIRSDPQIAIDRPFIFLLYDHVTGAILFLGRVVDPTRG